MHYRPDPWTLRSARISFHLFPDRLIAPATRFSFPAALQFTTKHLVDSGEFLRVGEVATPWPCFCICVSEAARKDAAKMSALNDVLAKVRARAEKFKQNEAGATIDHLMSEYKMLREDAEEWLGGVHWAVANQMDAGVLSTVKKTLLGLEIIQEDLADEKLVTEGCTISTK